MNEALVENWNKVVQPSDTIFHLGDVTFGHNIGMISALISRLNGEINLVPGNHDKIIKKNNFPNIKIVREHGEVMFWHEGYLLRLWHYPTYEFKNANEMEIYLHGHSHGKVLGNQHRIDVGVDCWNYHPISFEMIKERIELYRSNF